jgi:3-oxoacyl-[acyl-carrier-protein] synthase-3
MSNGGMAALGLGISHLMASAPDSLVLVTTSDRFEDIPRGRWDFDEGLVPGDGAAACVLSRRGGYARILSYAAHSESGLEGLHRGELKFGREPLAGSATSYRQRKREFLAGKSLIVLARTLRRAMLTVVDRALADAGIALADISRWVLPSFGLQLVHMSYLEPLGIDIKDTCWDLGRTTGHLGAGDQIAGLHFLRDTGAMQPGSKCALIGIGAGFNWSCSVVEFT